MSQYISGKIIINETNRYLVKGIGTLFFGNIFPGNIFIIDEDQSISFIIKSVISDTEFTITTPYYGKHIGKWLTYSISTISSNKFNIPEIRTDNKAFSTLASLSLRMIDSVFKNLGFISINDPRCVSSNSLRVKIYPQQAIDAQARWQLDNLPELFKSGRTSKNLSVGTHTVSFTELPSFISPMNISTIMEPNSNRIIVGRYTLLGVPVPILVELIMCRPDINTVLKRIPPKTVTATVIGGEGVVEPSSKNIPYRTQAVFDVTGGFKISSNTENIITGGTVPAVYNGSTVITDTMYEDGNVLIKEGFCLDKTTTTHLKPLELTDKISKKTIIKTIDCSITDCGVDNSHSLKSLELTDKLSKKTIIKTLDYSITDYGVNNSHSLKTLELLDMSKRNAIIIP